MNLNVESGDTGLIKVTVDPFTIKVGSALSVKGNGRLIPVKYLPSDTLAPFSTCNPEHLS
jgi:hypothetical protein